jgi:hypothetical protein
LVNVIDWWKLLLAHSCKAYVIWRLWGSLKPQGISKQRGQSLLEHVREKQTKKGWESEMERPWDLLRQRLRWMELRKEMAGHWVRRLQRVRVQQRLMALTKLMQQLTVKEQRRMRQRLRVREVRRLKGLLMRMRQAKRMLQARRMLQAMRREQRKAIALMTGKELLISSVRPWHFSTLKHLQMA